MSLGDIALASDFAIANPYERGFNGGGCSVLRNTYQADSVYMLKDFIRWKSSVYFITDDLRQMTREMPRAIGSDRGSARV